MLILSRQRDETVELGGGFSVGGIDVTVISIQGDKVRLGFNAPMSMTVHRREVADDIRRHGARRVPTTAETIGAHEAAVRKE